MTRLIDRLVRRYGNTFWEGEASGAAVLSTTYGSPDREAVLPQLAAWAQGANASSAVVFSAVLIRLMLFSEAVFKLQAKDDKHLFGNESLRLLEEPFGPETSTGMLLARMEQDASLAGNSYTWAPPGEGRLVRLRPDWTIIISEIVTVDGGGEYRNVTGYWWEPPKSVLDQGKGFFVPAEEVAHWAPLPDPQADFRGMSWLTPVARDINSDSAMVTYKSAYLDNNATPNVIIRYPQKLQPGTIDSIRERMKARYAGVPNAGKTLVLDQGADLTLAGNSMQQMDFTGVSAAGEQRILAAALVPGVLVGLEPLRGAGRGYQESMQKFANLWARPQWRSACSALAKFVDDPSVKAGGSRLWFDTSDIAALQDGEMERGQTALVRAQALLTLAEAGYTRASSVAAVDSGDLNLLQEVPGAPIPGTRPSAGNVQHLLGQPGQPGATAEPLPAGTKPRLPLGSVSPGDGGNNTRPTPQLASARRALTGANGNGQEN